MPKITCPIAFLFLLLACHSLIAQETTAEITGLVTEGHVPLSGAILTARHLPSGAQYVTASRRDGRYNLPNLKIGGPYTVTISFVGYKEEKKENIILLVGQEYKADFVLIPVSKELETVVVQNTGQGKVFNNSHTGPQEIIRREHLDNTPAIPRSIESFVSLFSAANGMNIGGRNALFNNITLDGANFSNVYGLSTDKRAHITGQAISIEAIEQIQVNTAPYDVRMGGFAGTNINVIGRSGTNKFKGSLYSFTTSSGLTGYKVGSTELIREDFSYNRSGFFAGGPIIKDKLFFFVNAERENLVEPATLFTASDSLHPPGEYVSFANADTLNKLRNFLIDRFQYDPGVFQGYNYTTRKDRFSVKIDWNVDTNTTFSFKYNRFHAFKDESVSNNGAPKGFRQPGTFGMPFKGSGYTIFNNINNFIAELNTNWQDDASNKLQAGYMYLRNYRETMAGKIFPFVDIRDPLRNTYTSFGLDPYSYNNLVHIDIFQLADIFTLYRGRHEITFGTQNFIKRYKSGFAPYYAGIYRFASLQDFYASADGKPNALGYNLGYSTAADNSFPFSRVGINELSLFVQDKIRFKNKLIITYGLRADMPFFTDSFPSNPYASALKFRYNQQYYVGQQPGTNLLLSPRFSFNWDVTKNVRTQIRGGAGLFAGPPPLIWLNNIASSNGAQLGSFEESSDEVIAFSPDITAHIPAERVWPKSYELALVNKDFKYPHVFKANFSIDRMLPGNIIASFDAAYAKDIHAIYFQNVNLPSAGTAFSGSDNRVRYTGPQINWADDDATPENPNISSAILMTNSNRGYAYVLTLQLQKRLSDFYFSTSYSYTKTKSLNDGGAMQSRMWSLRPVTGDPNSDELGNTDFYQPHRFLAYGSYRKAYGKYFATSLSFVFEAAPSGIGSYTYNGDMNNDGISNDLIYIPKDQDDILLVPVETINGGPVDHRTPSQIWVQLDNFIKQDKYLSAHRGQYAGRNEVVFPFFKRLDMNITQEFILGKEKHVIKLGFDLINMGNFINKNWGTYKAFTTGTYNTPFMSSFLQYEGTDANSGRPLISFPYLDPANEIPLTSTFTDDTRIFSRWQGQVSIRYIFQ